MDRTSCVINFAKNIFEVIKMPRYARQKSEINIYHVVIRGINRQQIFEDEEDNEKFLETLKRYKAVSECKLYAYCLMGNHVHLLLEVGKETLDLLIKRIAGSYVFWYNKKYDRSGHLFQGRYRSEVVENEGYFFNAMRYIHQNPLKAGLCNDISSYEYSSFMDYVNENHRLVDISFAFSIFNKDAFIKFNHEIKSDKYLDAYNWIHRVNDTDAIEIIQSISNCENSTAFQMLGIGLRDRFIKEMKEKRLSIRQINRLTGVSIGIVRRI